MRTGSRIRLAREAAQLTQRELAEKSGVPFGTLFKIEQGVIEQPKLVDIATIAAVFGKTCADFLPNDEPEPAPSGRGRPAFPKPDESPAKNPAKKKRQ